MEPIKEFLSQKTNKYYSWGDFNTCHHYDNDNDRKD